MKKWRLSRKRKKQWRKDDPFFNSSWSYKRKNMWEWFYFRNRVQDRAYKAIGIRN